MDKLRIKDLIQNKIDFYLNEFSNRITKLPNWKINQTLPSLMHDSTLTEKQEYLIERFKKENTLLIKLQTDLDLINSNEHFNSLDQLKSINIDPREFEGMGFSESQTEEFNNFVEKVQSAFNQS